MLGPTIRTKIISRYPGKVIQPNSDELAFIEMEKQLRRRAFQAESFAQKESFHDDSDMTSSFHILVVYHKPSNTPHFALGDSKVEMVLNRA